MGVSEFSYFFARSVMIGQTLYQFYDPLISLSFLLCWLPFVIMHMMRSISEQEAFQILFSASIWLGWTNSAINPVIYYSNYEVRIKIILFSSGIFFTAGYLLCVW